MSCDIETGTLNNSHTENSDLPYVWLVTWTQRTRDSAFNFKVQRLGLRRDIKRYIDVIVSDLEGVCRHERARRWLTDLWIYTERDVSGVGTMTLELVLGTEDDAMFRLRDH